MAREEAPREDLLGMAKALPERAEYLVPGFAEPILIGFRDNGGCSIFVGEDPVWHFNSQLELRRAFAGGKLYKAEQGRLIALTRVRSKSAVELLRHELTPAEQQTYLAATRLTLQRLRSGLTDPAVQAQAAESGAKRSAAGLPAAGLPEGGLSAAGLLPRVLAWLDLLRAEISVARTPHAI
jgi:hypothetical protein